MAGRLISLAQVRKSRRAAEERAALLAELEVMTWRLSRDAYLDSIAPHVDILVEVVGVVRASIEAINAAAADHAARYEKARELAEALGVPFDVDPEAPDWGKEVFLIGVRNATEGS